MIDPTNPFFTWRGRFKKSSASVFTFYKSGMGGRIQPDSSTFHRDGLRSLLERPSRESPRWVESRLLTKSSNMRLRVCFCVLEEDGSFKMAVLGGVVCAVEGVWVMMDDHLRDGWTVWDRGLWK